MGLGSCQYFWFNSDGKVDVSNFHKANLTCVCMCVPISNLSQFLRRMNHASVLVGRKIVVHGGWDGVRTCLNDGVWVFDTDTFGWMNPRTAGFTPPPRYGLFAFVNNTYSLC